MSENQQLREHIAHTFEAMGGVGSITDLVQAARAHASPTLDAYIRDRGWTSVVGAFLRSRGANGLPLAPEVDQHGTHMQLQLMSVEEFQYVIKRRMSESTASVRQAQKYAECCWETYGVRIDIYHPDTATA